MAALNKQNVNYNNINSVINYGKEIIKKEEDFFVDFREKKSNHNNDLKYIQKLIDFARELVISGEEYTDTYFRNLENAQDENINYDEHFENYIFQNPPKIIHYVITFNIGEETFTLRYSNKHYFTDYHGIHWSDDEPHGWPIKLQSNMKREALKYIDLAQETLNIKKDERNKLINKVVNKGSNGKAVEIISKKIKNYEGGLFYKKKKLKSKGGSKKIRKTRRNNKRKTKRQTKKNIKKIKN